MRKHGCAGWVLHRLFRPRGFPFRLWNLGIVAWINSPAAGEDPRADALAGAVAAIGVAIEKKASHALRDSRGSVTRVVIFERADALRVREGPVVPARVAEISETLGRAAEAVAEIVEFERAHSLRGSGNPGAEAVEIEEPEPLTGSCRATFEVEHTRVRRFSDERPAAAGKKRRCRPRAAARRQPGRGERR